MLCCGCKNNLSKPRAIDVACCAYPEKEIKLLEEHSGYFEFIDGIPHKLTACEKRKERKHFKIARAFRGGFGE